MRLIVPAAAALVFAVFAALYVWWPETYEALLQAWAVPTGEIPFIDIHAVLSAIQCHRLGEDVYTVNSCDLIGRLHAYSPFWLVLPIPADVAQTTAWGLAVTLVFLTVLAVLPVPSAGRAVAVMLAAVLSPSVMLAVERANNDMVVLAVAVLAGFLASRHWPWRIAAYVLITLAALLKYYPAAALAVALRERWRRLAGVALTSLAAAVVTAAAFHDQWEGALRLLKVNLRYGLYTFSLANPIEYAAPAHPALTAPPLRGLLTAGLMLAFAGVVATWRLRMDRQGLALRPDRPADMLLAVSGLMLAGCFVTGSSLPYRAVLALPVLPALLEWSESHADPGARATARLMAWSLVYLLWLPLLHHALAPVTAAGGAAGALSGVVQALLIAVKETGWWAVASFLVAVALPLPPWPAAKR